MSGYVKLFSEIVESSIWDESHSTRVVWITLLALCDPDGFVRGSVGWLASKAKVSEFECSQAIAKFASPDPHSRTPDYEGRRIEQLDDGWLVLNYLAFRDRLSSDAKAVATRERVEKHRKRYKALRNAKNVTGSNTASASASASASESVRREEVQEGRGSEAHRPSLNEAVAYGQIIGLAPWRSRDWWQEMESCGWLDYQRRPVSNWRAMVSRVKTKWEADGRPNGPPKSKAYPQLPLENCI